MQITDVLQNLGLSDKEARVYVALLKLGRSSAYGIAEESGLKKPTAYVILDELTKKGLALKVPRAKKQLFIARSPEEYFASLEERVQSAKKILPELMAFSEGKCPKPKTLFFEGFAKIKQIYEWHVRKMKNKEIVGFYAHAGDATPELTGFFWELARNFKNNNTTIRGIVPEHPNVQDYREADKEYGREMKIVPFEEYSSDVSVEIGEGYIMFFSFKDMQVTLIENKSIAKTLKQVFEIAWKR